MPDIMHFLRIQADPARVFGAIATADGVRNWWTRDADLDERAGGEGKFRFYGGKTATRVRVDTLTPPESVGWTVTESNAPGGWPGTTIRFDLTPDAGGTVLRFAHRGYAEANDGYAIVTTGWAYFLVSLRRYAETGQGAPAPDVDFMRMLD